MDLPTLNASLNFLALCFLTAGFIAIKSGRKNLHALLMIAAFITSTVFLVSYLIYHYSSPINTFNGPLLARIIYFPILIIHILFAFTIPPLAIATIYTAATKRFTRHKKIAKTTLPIWMFVSVSGIIVYFMLYRWY